MCKQGLLIAILLLFSGTAAAASIESLVMPGPVIEGHADLEEECSSCHDLFDSAAQRRLCLDCHERIAEDLALTEGFHSHNQTAKTAQCTECHTEHKGRDADIVGLQPELFDHDATDFPLEEVHATQSCDSCHQPETSGSVATGALAGVAHFDAPTMCVGCHDDDDVHQGNLEDSCGDCHDPSTWKSGQFDHSSTDFDLIGKHAEANCSSCHLDQQFLENDSACVDCHRLDDVHGGSRGDDCADCHNSDSWETDFDHESETEFPLVGAHQSLTCSNCHISETDYSGLPDSCQGCHGADDVHLGRNGSECESCHDQDAWEVGFDHLAETDFELVAAHAEQACTACHTGSLTDPLASECIDCHSSDDPHDATLTDCAGCHGQDNWAEAAAFHHDLSDFPLVGLHRTVSCEQCHETLTYSPLAGDCQSCHLSEDVHERALGDSCETCHNPVGWEYWLFEHDVQTEFSLTGAHEQLVCDACHTPGNKSAGAAVSPDKVPTTCVACHRADDIHRGGFGQKCDRCHSTASFEQPLLGN
jgi:predicted CXXCH cytochrome family protein